MPCLPTRFQEGEGDQQLRQRGLFDDTQHSISTGCRGHAFPPRPTPHRQSGPYLFYRFFFNGLPLGSCLMKGTPGVRENNAGH